jgi:O-antigen ligase
MQGLARYITLARGELRLVLAGAPAFARRGIFIASWSIAAILAGCVTGLFAVVMPPMATFGFLGVFALVLLWVAPDTPIGSDTLIRRLFFVALAADISIPIYYSVILSPSLPWISLRRVLTFAMIVLFAVAFSTSPDARRRITDVVRKNRWIAACVFGYPIVAVVSILTSVSPLGSISELMVTLIEVYMPFVAALYVIQNEDDVNLIVRVVLCCALFNTFISIMDFTYHRGTMIWVLPKFWHDALIEGFPRLAGIEIGMVRHGEFRASSIFENSLSFGEFEGMIAPLAAVFIAHGRNFREKAFGVVVVVACLIGIFVSGARGGYNSAIVGSGVLAFLWVLRSSRLDHPRSLNKSVAGVTAVAGFAFLIAAIIVVPALHTRILGGGREAISNEGRRAQWELATPHILHNPITGSGYGLAATVINYIPQGYDYPTVDSYLLTVITETGIPGVAAFFGSILLSIWFAGKRYCSDRSWHGALMGGFAGSLSAYMTYRLFLSQRENFTLQYLVIACVMFLNYFYLQRKGQDPSLQQSGVATLRRRSLAAPIPPSSPSRAGT